jgi:ribonuclease P/MRP protein subunit RPP40
MSEIAAHEVTGKIGKWIESWLIGRKQQVHFQGQGSTWYLVTSGVLQGLVLGPLLFLIFINDVNSELTSCILNFADDTKVFTTIEDDRDSQELQKGIDKLARWTEEWQMKFNVDECKVMHIGQTNPEATYNMNGKELRTIEDE